MNALATFDEALIARLPAEDILYLDWQRRWSDAARPDQIPLGDWTECGYQCGRGYGKTRVGAEWLGRSVYEDPSGHPSAIVCPTFSDVKFTAFEGESGLLAVVPAELIMDYNRSDLTITMRNIAGGSSLIRGFTAEKPERLRGPQHCRGWLDEIAAWQRDEETWDMYQFGLRLGDRPQTLWTSTPKPRELIRKLTVPKPNRVIVYGGTYDNRDNLPDSFLAEVSQYEGTTIGRQELHGELIDPEEAGIVRRSWFKLWPAKKRLPAFDFILMSLDTAFTEATQDRKTHDPDATACVVLGVFKHKIAGKDETHIMVLDCWDGRLGMPELIKRVRKESQFHYGDATDQPLFSPMFGTSKPKPVGRKPDLILIEDKGSGISLRQMLEREHIEAYAYNPGRADKLARLHMVSHVFARQRVWLPESDTHPGRPRNWCEPMLAQVCSFAGTGSIKHDDYVDSLTQALRVALDKGLMSVVEKKPEKREEVVVRVPEGNPYAM